MLILLASNCFPSASISIMKCRLVSWFYFHKLRSRIYLPVKPAMMMQRVLISHREFNPRL